MYLWPIFIFICLKKVKVQFAQLSLTVCDPMECTLLGSSVHGILQARILGWVAFPFSRGSSQPRDGTQVSRVAGLFTVSATGEALKEERHKRTKSVDEH